MSIFVFTGPSLPPDDARTELEAVFLPPVSQGDMIRVVRNQPQAIGIIDGFFESVPAVWHKEILYALSQGIHVFGSASMGALRAAELAPFGMVGVGAIFEAFRNGFLEDDDEVAVINGPAELGYPVLSEPMVNIRRTLSDATRECVITETTRQTLERIAKALPYSRRSYFRIIDVGSKEGLSQDTLERLRTWLPSGSVDQKREDAILMLRTMRQRLGELGEPRPVGFHFEHTTLWESALRPAA